LQILLLESALVDHFVSQEASPIELEYGVSHPPLKVRAGLRQ
jgi:hypothetical protein